MNYPKMLLRLLLCGSTMIAAASALGQTTLQSARNGYWDVGTTWNTGTIPTSLDLVIVRNANTVTLNTAQTITDLKTTTNGSLVIEEGGSLVIRANASGGGAQFRGAFNSNGSFVMNGGTLMQARTLTYASTMTIAQVNSTDASMTGSFTQNGGNVYVNGMISIATNPSGSVGTASGTYQLNGGALYIHTSTPTVSAAGSNYVGWACGIESQRQQSRGTFSWMGGAFSANYLRENLTNTGSGTLSFDTVAYSTDTSSSYATYGQVTSVNNIGRVSITDFNYAGGVFSAMAGNLTYNQGASASMAIDIAGTAQGQYDQLRWVAGSTTSTVAGGTVNLAAGTTIEVNVADGTPLHAGDTFYIVLAGAAINITGGDVSSIVLSGIDASNFELALTTTTLSSNSYGDAFAGTAMYKGADSITVQALTLTYIPEPAVAAGVLGVLALALASRRRRA